MHLSILAENGEIESLYCNHSTYHEGDSGLDLFFIEEINIGAKSTKLISLGIKCEAYPDKDKESNISYYLYPRSSISKTPLRMSNSIGLIDGGYRGEIIAVCDNIKTEPYTVEKGQRLFQLVAADNSPIHFKLTDQLEMTSRGTGGFGSTGRF